MTLDEIAARADAATEGPWGVSFYGCGGGPAEGCEVVTPAGNSLDMATALPDAEFIAHAREDVPRLLAALRAVEARCDESEKASIRSFARTFDGSLFDAMLSTREIRAAIREALGS